MLAFVNMSSYVPKSKISNEVNYELVQGCILRKSWAIGWINIRLWKMCIVLDAKF